MLVGPFELERRRAALGAAPARSAVALALAAAWFGGLAGGPPAALAAGWVETEQTAVRLIAATEAVGREATVALGLHFRLADGWKIYWRSPGDAGFPPRIDWSGSRNLAGARVGWPAPQRFSVLGLETLGYTGEVVMPITATLAEAGRPLDLAARVDYLTCKDICIPYSAQLALDLPAGSPTPTASAHLINRFAVRVPGDGAAHGLAIERAEVVVGGRQPMVRVVARADQPFAAPDLLVEGPAEVQFAAPRVNLSEGGRRATLEVAAVGGGDVAAGLAGTRLTFTVVDGGRSAERTLTAGTAAGAGAGAALAIALGLALLGGLILNLMPCVLPVLSIKLLSVIGHGGGERGWVRLSFVASAGGIVAAFLALAGVLAALKAAGLAIGWGIQFQQPWFLIAMTLVVTLFACNLWGFFELRLPRWIADLGEHSHRLHGLGGSFLAGAFATVLATPCSAPFVGTAVGFALSRGTTETFAIFAALGLGLALPYLVVAAAPELAMALPKPGRWMVVLRRALGFALAATGGWLLGVLASQAGDTVAIVVGALMAASAGTLYLGHRMGPPVGRAGTPALAILAFLAFLVPSIAGEPVGPARATKGASLDALWRPFDEAAIAGWVAAGKTVFVDVTADWCITCQLNKSVVLGGREVFRRLSADSVIAMRADWTHPDDSIAAYLAGFGRYGIPFNAVYGPAAPRGTALPELLTEGAVVAALERARGTAAAAAR